MRCIVSVVAGLLIMSASTVLGQVQDLRRTISVSGTVVSKTAPDVVVWRVSLQDSDKDLRAAKKRSDSKIQSVIALRKKLKIAAGDLETGHVSIRREYERGQHGHRESFKHFVVARSVTIRQRDLKRFDEYLDTLVSSAEMEVSFRFEASRVHEVRSETRLKALKVAKDKAAAMAGVVGAKLGRVLSIQEHQQGGSWRTPASNSATYVSRPSVDITSDKFVPGAINVQVTVYATFELE